jgi:hypothetical protein
MNTRKIHTIDRSPNFDCVRIDRGAVKGAENEREIVVHRNVIQLIGLTGAKFARRQFAGATKLTFAWRNVPTYDIWYGRAVFESDNLWLCADTARKVLNLGKQTKTFSLWYKRVPVIDLQNKALDIAENSLTPEQV